MFYVAFFRYEFDDPELGASEGRFTYAVEADDVDEACQKMAATIPEMHGELLRGTDQLFLDDLIELGSVPEGGIVLRAEHNPLHDEIPLFLGVLPGYDGDECHNFRQGPDPEVDLEAANAYEQEPFIAFEDADASEAEPDV